MKRKSFIAVEKLYRTQKKKLLEYVLAQFPQSEIAEDIVADCFLEAIDKEVWFEKQDEDVQMKMLYQIAQKYCNRMERIQRRHSSDLEFREDSELLNYCESQYRGQKDVVMDQHMSMYCLRELRSDERELMLMRYRDGKTIDEIAEIKDLSTCAVYKRLQRIRKKLKKSSNTSNTKVAGSKQCEN